ncbi:PLDc_N domain-containing protein [Actinotalea sp. BY-33]|uniref:PLDc_N domain-containing protein n=1 Tax=Actinotalea soli TaxID=2819234 RepID=A0A939LR63_9CELL|nr:PLD nuclease N-terminal domain-containing protein [Actinotalea soli]MBO1753207.1 PLDc_N domain-containing protein [Actinotalea soli]
MIRGLAVVIQLALLVYCLIECIQTDSSRVRNLPKTLWVLLIILVPVIGPVAWLVAGRPEREAASNVPWPATRTAGFPEYERPRPPRGPDDDPEFLTGLGHRDAEHEEMLSQWEATLRDRERRLREGSPSSPEGTTPARGGAEPGGGAPGSRGSGGRASEGGAPGSGGTDDDPPSRPRDANL